VRRRRNSAMSTPEEQQEKQDLAYYAATLTAWFNTRLEHDKSLLTLSSAGIGLLISLVSKFSIASAEALILYIAALTAFILCLISVLWIYKQNSNHLEDVNRDGRPSDPILSVLDTVAICTFVAGIVFSAILSVGVAITSFESRDIQMSAEDKGKNTPQQLDESFNRAQNMKQGTVDPLSKSFNNAGNLKTNVAPQPVPPSPALAPSAPAKSATPAPGGTKTP
jgi:hypothetical protein